MLTKRITLNDNILDLLINCVINNSIMFTNTMLGALFTLQLILLTCSQSQEDFKDPNYDYSNLEDYPDPNYDYSNQEDSNENGDRNDIMYKEYGSDYVVNGDVPISTKDITTEASESGNDYNDGGSNQESEFEKLKRIDNKIFDGLKAEIMKEKRRERILIDRIHDLEKELDQLEAQEARSRDTNDEWNQGEDPSKI